MRNERLTYLQQRNHIIHNLSSLLGCFPPGIVSGAILYGTSITGFMDANRISDIDIALTVGDEFNIDALCLREPWQRDTKRNGLVVPNIPNTHRLVCEGSFNHRELEVWVWPEDTLTYCLQNERQIYTGQSLTAERIARLIVSGQYIYVRDYQSISACGDHYTTTNDSLNQALIQACLSPLVLDREWNREIRNGQ